jgi:peptidoglycan/LPS O-acetylase OafA/YrhL
MRTIAVGSVLVAHAGVPFLAGGFIGVDVFFVLSGFLITGLLGREVARTGRVSLAGFWARRAKRLLPASATVLAFSALVTYLYLPITQRKDFGGDIVSAALYVVNWRLAARGVDYQAEDIGDSPVQHYWSLAVEEQFYLVWPILMLLVAVLAARRWKQVSFVVLGLVTAASFAYSVAHTQSSAQTAYFVSTTRIWELGIGALLALSATRVARLPGLLRAVGGWVGIGLIAYGVLVFEASTPAFPGTAALVPTLGAALMIASGLVHTPGSPQRLLSLKPMVWIGGLSYSIYLWHWPMLVAAQAKYPDLRLRWTVLLMILSIVPAWICHKVIENPVRFGTAFKPSGRALGMGAALTAMGLVIGLGLNASASIGVVDEASSKDSLGARALLDPANADVVWSDVKKVDAMRPLPIDAPEDRPPFYTDQPECQVGFGDPTPHPCLYGDPTADRTVLIVGDSKIGQWQTVLTDIAEDEGWKLVQLTKSGCAFADHVRGAEIDRDCQQWQASTRKMILDMKPDLVITSQRHKTAFEPGTRTLTEGAMVDGIVEDWRALTSAGIPVVALLDNPSPDAVVYECVAQHPDDLTACAFDKARAIAGSGAAAQRAAARRVDGVSIVDMTDVICPDEERCSAVVGNVLTYRQGSHVTRTYADSMRPQLSAALARATDGAFGSG